MSIAQDLHRARPSGREVLFGIVGLGYVGLPLAVEFAQGRLPGARLRRRASAWSTGSTRGSRTSRTCRRRSSRRSCERAGSARRPTSRGWPSRTRSRSACRRRSPSSSDPDMSYIIAATEAVEAQAHPARPGVILESTTYPGTTREILLPALESTRPHGGRGRLPRLQPRARRSGQSGLRHTKNTPKVVGGITPTCTEVATALYAACIDTLVPVSTHRGGRAGEAAREHVPHREHRPGERDGDRLRQARRRRLGSDRGGGDEAVRLHEIHARARASAATASRSIRTTSRGRCARSTTRRGSSISPARSTARCRRSGSRRSREALNGERKAVTAATSSCSASRTSGTSTTCARARRSTSSACSRSRARGSPTTIRTCRASRGWARVSLGAARRPRRVAAADCVMIVTDHTAVDYQHDHSATGASWWSTPATQCRKRPDMHVAVIGSGYVGLVAGACLAETGNDVVCADMDADKIARLQRNEIPIYEPGLEPMVAAEPGRGPAHLHHRPRRPRCGAARVVFIAVGTPPGEDGSADLQHVLAVAKEIGRNMNDAQGRRHQVHRAGRHRREGAGRHRGRDHARRSPSAPTPSSSRKARRSRTS